MRDLDSCLAALIQVLGKPENEIALHEPKFSGNEWIYVKSCLDTGWVSSAGEYVSEFERKIAEFTGIPYAVAVVNGTAALHLSLMLADVKPDDEVLIPALTFVATANAVTYCSAVPHFVECTSHDLGIDVEKLAIYLKQNTMIRNGQCLNKATGRRMKVIIPVHIFGHAGDLFALNALAEEYHLTVIEDASESLGSYYQGKHTGSFSRLSVLSFNGNKIITTGGGGAILTSDPELARKAKHLSSTAKLPHRSQFYHDELGYNYRLPNINAALGCAQLEQLPALIDKKRSLAERYFAAFKDVKGVKIIQEPQYTKGNYWLNALILENPDRQFIEDFIELASQHKFNLRGLWTPLHRLPMYQACPKMDLSTTAALYDSIISLPSSAHLESSHG